MSEANESMEEIFQRIGKTFGYTEVQADFVRRHALTASLKERGQGRGRRKSLRGKCIYDGRRQRYKYHIQCIEFIYRMGKRRRTTMNNSSTTNNSAVCTPTFNSSQKKTSDVISDESVLTPEEISKLEKSMKMHKVSLDLLGQ